MPIIQIHAIRPNRPEAIPALIAEIREEGAKALQCGPDNLWVMFHPLDETAQGQAFPPVVFVKAQEGRSTETQAALVAAITQAVGRALGCPPESVWVQYQEMRPQEICYHPPQLKP
jgi:phenylpyruvate tautomerase PptA (4-oxalocrotonate tautomerase family)